MRPVGPFPNFLIIGAQNCAIRWLREGLGRHPDIYVVPREIGFFNRHYHRGPEWYRTWFDEWSGQPAIGEATPGYMILREDPRIIAARIDGMLPDVRVLALLCNPVDRARLSFAHHMARGRIPPSADLLDYVEHVDPERDRLGIVSGGWYARSLQPYAERFGDRLLVLMQDDPSVDPAVLMQTAAGHLGVRPQSLSYDTNGDQPGAGSDVNDPIEASHLSAEQRLQLYRLFAKDIAELGRLFPLRPQLWREERAEAVTRAGP